MASYRKVGNRWEGRISFTDPLTKKRKQKSVRGNTKSEVVKKSYELQLDLKKQIGG